MVKVVSGWPKLHWSFIEQQGSFAMLVERGCLEAFVNLLLCIASIYMSSGKKSAKPYTPRAFLPFSFQSRTLSFQDITVLRCDLQSIFFDNVLLVYLRTHSHGLEQSMQPPVADGGWMRGSTALRVAFSVEFITDFLANPT